MAREVIEKLIDDLTGGDAAETVSFGLDGSFYEIDLSRQNARALRKALAPYVKASRQAKPQVSPGVAKVAASRRARARRGYDLVALREWAAANGIPTPARGKIPMDIVRQYKEAGGR